MLKWNDISLFKFQQICRIQENKNLSELDRMLYCVCEAYDFTEYEFDNMPKKKIGKYIADITDLFNSELVTETGYKIGDYYIDYNIGEMRFGQYVELSHFLSDTTVNAHKILSSISYLKDEKNTSKFHNIRAEFFLTQPMPVTMGSVGHAVSNYNAFNKLWGDLFGVDSENKQEIESDVFNKRFGWVYSATTIAKLKGIPLDSSYDISTVEAFNHLAYLKALAKYEEKMLKKK